MLISGEYLELNKQCHSENRGWGKGGTKWLPHITKDMRDLSCVTVLDYGCGKGALVEALHDDGFMATGYDPAMPQYSLHGFVEGMHDYVVCTDVLEHIEYVWIDAVLAEIADTASNGAFLVISLRKAQKLLPNGQNAHIIIESEDWWYQRLLTHFSDFDIDCTVYLAGKPKTPNIMLVYCRKLDGNPEDTER